MNEDDIQRIFAEQAKQAAQAAMQHAMPPQIAAAARVVPRAPAVIPLTLNCEKCGTPLEARSTEAHDDQGLLGARRGFVIAVTPCPVCVETLRRPLSVIIDLIKNSDEAKGELATHLMVSDVKEKR